MRLPCVPRWGMVQSGQARRTGSCQRATRLAAEVEKLLPVGRLDLGQNAWLQTPCVASAQGLGQATLLNGARTMMSRCHLSLNGQDLARSATAVSGQGSGAHRSRSSSAGCSCHPGSLQATSHLPPLRLLLPQMGEGRKGHGVPLLQSHSAGKPKR